MEGHAKSPLPASFFKPFEGGPSFSFQHRLIRLGWNITWSLFASWTPPPMRRWRNWLLKLFGARVHPSANVYGSARVWYPANLTMGPHSSLGPEAICYCMGPVEIGARAVISQRALLCGGTHDIDDPHFQLKTAPICIGADAWIAAEAFVGPGVNVGAGAVLGARGVTAKDLAPWTVYAGNPAKPLRARRRLESYQK